jgi:hypothetical protein
MDQMSTSFQKHFVGQNGESVVLEDDGVAGYVYLISENEEVISDVWLYNRALTPQVAPWISGETPPFLNATGYIIEQSEFTPPEDSGGFTADWIGGHVEIRFMGHLFAVLKQGAKPGWSFLAAKSGPLAKPLKDFLRHVEV